ncbi:MAG: M48 family metalloprotease, partial [Cyanobacteria bacterium J06573_2]
AWVYWREYGRGVESGKNLESQIFVPLQLLTKKYPEFIPGHLELAKVCQEKPKACKKNASPGNPKNTIEVLERATEIFPDDSELVKEKVEALEKSENYLEAAIAARQFAVIYGDYSEAAEFAERADKNFKRYQNNVRLDFKVGCVVGQILPELIEKLQKGDKVENIKGCEVLELLQKGESYLGQGLAEKYEEKEKPKLVDDPKVLNYVKGIAGRIAPFANRNDFKYDYHIFEDSAVKIFGFPGGVIYISTGAIEKTNSEAQLAGLLGKEIAHSAFSHWSTNRVVKNILYSWKEFIPLGDLVTSLITLHHSQKQERQADILATKLLNSSGYAADGLHNAIVLQTGKLTKRNYQIQNLIKRNRYKRYAYEGVKPHLCIQNQMKGVSLDSCQ